jgi:hypothetical protein
MLRIKNAELIARWAESFGYSVTASLTCADGIHLALSHPKGGTWEIIAGEDGECVTQDGGPSDGQPVWSLIRRLAEAAGTNVPELVARAQHREKSPRRCAERIEILRGPETPSGTEDDVWIEITLPERTPYLPDEDPEEK